MNANTNTASHNAKQNTASLADSEDTTVSIVVDGEIVCFDYDEMINFHQGDSWFGCAVGFRAMQLAARELSGDTLWSRDNLTIVSGHPGAGVKDAIELVSGVLSASRFQLLDSIATQGCNRFMKFEWWLSDTERTLHIKLRDNIVPETFFILLDRLSNNNAQDGNSDSELGIEEKREEEKRKKEQEHNQFDQMKSDLSDEIWNQSLDTSFEFTFLTTALKAGELPDA